MNFARVVCVLIIAFFYGPFLLVCVARAKEPISKHPQNKDAVITIKLQAQKAIPAAHKVLLRGQIDMLSYACKEVGITLSESHLPALVKNVITGSSAYYANIKAGDKIVGTDFKNNRFCVSLARAGKPYYTEIRLSAQTSGTPSPPPSATPVKPNSNGLQARNAIGFRFTMGTGEVTYIDPKSDLFGQIKAGDTFISITNNPPGLPSTNSSHEAIIYPIFKHNGISRYYPCREKPIESFARPLRESLRQEGFGAWGRP